MSSHVYLCFAKLTLAEITLPYKQKHFLLLLTAIILYNTIWVIALMVDLWDTVFSVQSKLELSLWLALLTT